MRFLIAIFSIIFVISSCQNSHHVTHNKRKYTKGYYQTKHKRVKHFNKRKNSTSEAVAQKSKSRKKSPETPQEGEVITTESQAENTSDQIKRVEETYDDHASNSKEEQSKTNVTTRKDSKENSDKSNNFYQNSHTDKRSQNEAKDENKSGSRWIFVLSWIFVPLSILFALGSLLAILVDVWLVFVSLGLFLITVVTGITLNSINYKVTKRANDNEVLKRHSVFFIILFSIFFTVVLIFLLVILFASF